jgi:hypothetical protein
LPRNCSQKVYSYKKYKKRTLTNVPTLNSKPHTLLTPYQPLNYPGIAVKRSVLTKNKKKNVSKRSYTKFQTPHTPHTYQPLDCLEITAERSVLTKNKKKNVSEHSYTKFQTHTLPSPTNL